MSMPDFALKSRIDALVYDSCHRLNVQDWSGFLELCDHDDFRYRIVNYSPEIQREQCWMDRDYGGLQSIFTLLPRHNSDHAVLTRHAVVQQIRVEDGAGEALVHSPFSLYSTAFDAMSSPLSSGQTQLFAVGRYEDRVRIDEHGGLRLKERVVRLETRQIGIGSHVPF